MRAVRGRCPIVPRLAILPCLLLALSSCASNPLDRREALDLAAGSPVPRVIWIKVECGEGLFGSREDWSDDLWGVFRDLNVCAAVRTEDDGPADGADLEVAVTLERGEPRDPEIDAQGALLDFLAWSAVPPLPLWIADVRVDPGVKVRLTAAPLPGGKKVHLGAMECPALRTCQRERFPFFSWPTLGAVLVPPFLFSHPDPSHLETSICNHVRMEVALRIAEAVKTALPEQSELLSGLSVEGGVLTFVPAPHLKDMVLRVEPADSGVPRVPSGPRIRVTVPYEEAKDGSPKTQSLKALVPGQRGEDLLLRIEASGRLGEKLRYSLPLPATEPVGSGRSKA